MEQTRLLSRPLRAQRPRQLHAGQLITPLLVMEKSKRYLPFLLVTQHIDPILLLIFGQKCPKLVL